MNVMNLNDLVVVAWKHTFLGHITWNLVVFADWLVPLYVLAEFLCSIVLQLFTHGTPKRKIKSKLKLEKAVILRRSVRKVFSNIY